MAIDKIGNINNIIEPKKSNPVTTAKETKKKDSVQISSEGKMAAQVAKLTQTVRETPDIRVDRVQQIKEQIANGSYNFNDAKILEQVANRIANFLLRK
ncbi:MAG: flagellar biosynthesis anti-sigma factor FlgM [Spirochaetes bacterium RBG_16_49_21]|nr:MAG: flagellar biosynthesis anti-sigma factor FlgM [Spirochaetes bacterium RBG_16_49_21]